jgi:hypothetical protein
LTTSFCRNFAGAYTGIRLKSCPVWDPTKALAGLSRGSVWNEA